jgi:nuclear protein localization protein 4 homolog
MLTLRIRTQVGVWRLQNVNKTDTLRALRHRIEEEHHTDLKGMPFISEKNGKVQLLDDLTVQAAGLEHGDMLFAVVDESKTGIHEHAVSGKRITKDGTIVTQEYSDVSNNKGFRPGMMPLRSMKMAWTLNEFVALDSQFEFKIKRQEAGICSKAVVDKAVIQDFQAYMMNFDYRKIR